MKTITTTFLLAIFLLTKVNCQNAIFLHHSTGGAVFSEGNVNDSIAAYNTANQTNYHIDEFAYPDNPYDWANYPFDFWNLWINGRCHSDSAGIECLETILDRYDVVIFKHCFPGANIQADSETPDVGSAEKTVANYKLQYRALLEKFDQFPNKKFVAWTLAPQHRNATNADEAARAREFVNWVKNDWLTEGVSEHPNVFVFDFYNIVAESDPSPANGEINCLKYDYEGDHEGSDGHPNELANIKAGEEFADFMIQVFQAEQANSTIPLKDNKIEIKYNAHLNSLSIYTGVQRKTKLSIFNLSGQHLYSLKLKSTSELVDISFLPKGVYVANVVSDNESLGNIKIMKIN